MHISIIMCNLYSAAVETKESDGKTFIKATTTAPAKELITFIHNYFLLDEICCSRSLFLVNYYVRYRIVTVFLLLRMRS